MPDKTIIALSDIHEDFESLERALDFASTRNPDLIVMAGDLNLLPYTLDDIKEFSDGRGADKKKLADIILGNFKANDEEVKRLLQKSQIPYVAVPGNYDAINFDETFWEQSVDMDSYTLDELLIAGYGGADAFPPHIAAIQPLITGYSGKELYKYLTKTKPHIAVLHNPPRMLCDTMFNGNEVGSLSALAYVAESQPRLVIAGHIHESGPLGNNPKGVKGIAKRYSTVVVNPGNLGRFALIDPRTLTREKEFDYGTLSEIVVDSATAQVKKVTHYSIKNPEKNALVQELATYDFES